jgi:hypothetical protein
MAYVALPFRVAAVVFESDRNGLDPAHVELLVTRAWSVRSTERDSLRPRDAPKTLAAFVFELSSTG